MAFSKKPLFQTSNSALTRLVANNPDALVDLGTTPLNQESKSPIGAFGKPLNELTGKSALAQAGYKEKADAYRTQLGQEFLRAAEQERAKGKQFEDAWMQAKTAYESLERQALLHKSKIAKDPNYRGAVTAVSDEQLAAARAAMEQAMAVHTAFQEESKGRLQKLEADRNQKFAQLDEALKTIDFGQRKQDEYDQIFDRDAAEYDKYAAQYGKDAAAYKRYQDEKAVYDKNMAQREEDLLAGKYRVDPYAYIRSGAGLNKIQKMRELLNKGEELNMDVPEYLKPKEVKDPGVKREGPVKQYANRTIDPALAKILGYKNPDPPPKPAVKQTPQEKALASGSVVATPPAAPPTPPAETAAPVPPAPPAPAAQQTTQATQEQVGQTNQTTQTPPGAPPPTSTVTPQAAPEPTPEAGAKSGQSSTAGQAPETPAPQEAEPKPEPFSADLADDEDKENVWEQK